MRKSVLALLSVALLAACASQNTPQTTHPLSEGEARQIAEQHCIKGGEALAAGQYDPEAQVWRFEANLNSRTEGCRSECLVSEKDQSARIDLHCDTQNIAAKGFAIYLAETGETVLSEQDIISYEPTTGTFILTDIGAGKISKPEYRLEWPADLYQKVFLAKIGNEEIYRGKFWSWISSSSEPGIVMQPALLAQTDVQAFQVTSGYVSEPKPEDLDKINDERILERFRSLGKLKEGEATPQ